MSVGKRSPASSFCSLGGLIPGRRRFAPLRRRSAPPSPQNARGAFARAGLGWILVLIALAVCPLSPSGWAQTGPASDSGTFQIFVAKQRVGTEKFRMTRGASGWEATGELELRASQGSAVTETATLKLDSAMRPSFYERQQKAPQTGSLSAQFGPAETSLVSVTPEGANEQIFYLPEHFLVVLDTNFFHHYSFLLRQYDSSRGGSQPFNVFIPQEALPGTIYLEFLGRESLTLGSAARELDHYKGVTDEMEIEIWATPEDAVQRVWIPNANLEVLRQ